MTRHKQLVKVIENGLIESSKCIDTHSAVQECYGDDISMFADSNSSSENDGTEMLANLIQGVLEKINDEMMKNQIHDILKREDVETKLSVLDKVIGEFVDRQRLLKEEEERDKKTAEDAMKSVQVLPHGVEVSDIMKFQAYKVKMKIRDKLAAELETAERRQEELQSQMEKEREDVNAMVKKINDETLDPLERAGEICSVNFAS
mmetsp:Transcript_8289/g.10507  ORF Transcript_8289/g.10507 Transcript_8289/m.10507 type:complete len:204 (+) Transcript_8289:82-693(+)